MDIKTLEYLEERAKRGRAIVNRIAQLKEQIEQMEKHGAEIRLRSVRGDYIGDFRNNPDADEMTRRMFNAFFEAANTEIDRLKQELADL